jgi:hypothetical protein
LPEKDDPLETIAGLVPWDNFFRADIQAVVQIRTH